MPFLEQRLLVVPRHPPSFVRLELELSLPADVGEVRRDRSDPLTAAGDFDHDFRRPADGAPDLLDLVAAETHARWTRAPTAENVEQRAAARWKADR
jgi:hypothetical protein